MTTNTIKHNCENWGAEEVLGLVRGVLRSGGIVQLQSYLEQMYDVPLHLLNSGRAGLKLSLDQCRLRSPNRQIVITPNYVCPSVTQAIKDVGLCPIHAPVNSQLNLDPTHLVKLLDNHCLAVVMIHMHGVPADFQTIRSMTKANSSFLIDDAAQVAGIKVGDVMLGTTGDFGILSFAQGKAIVCGVRGSGGALLNTTGIPLNPPLHPTYSWSRLPKYWHFWASYMRKGAWKTLDTYIERIKTQFTQRAVNYFPDGHTISEPDARIAIAQFIGLSARVAVGIDHAQLAINKFATCRNLFAIQFSDSPRFVTRFIIQTRKLSPDTLRSRLTNMGVECRKVYSSGSRPYDGENDSGLLELPWIRLTTGEVARMLDIVCSLD